MVTRILVVDDDPSIRQALTHALAESAHIRVAASAEEALSGLVAAAPDVILSDVRMPGLGGIELLRLVRERSPGVDVVMMVLECHVFAGRTIRRVHAART